MTFYVEYDGLGAHADAWEATAAYAILHRTPAGGMMSEVARQVLGRVLKTVPGNTMTGDDLVALQEHVGHHGFALAMYHEEGAATSVFVLNGLGETKEIRRRFGRSLRFLLQMEEGAVLPAPSRVRSRDLFELKDRDDGERKPEEDEPARPGAVPFATLAPTIPATRLTWWQEGDALILVRGPAHDSSAMLAKPDDPKKDLGALHRERVASVLNTIDGAQPNASTHPGRADALAQGRDIVGFEPNGLLFADSSMGKGVFHGLRDRSEPPWQRNRETPNEFDFLEAMDLARAERIVGRWGFRGKALLTDIRFDAPAPWGGLAGMLDRRGVRADRLPPIPSGMGAFAVVSSDRAKSFDKDARLADWLKPETLRTIERAMRDATERRLRKDLLGHLGPTCCVYAAPGSRDVPSKSATPAFVIEIDNAEAFGKALDAWVSRVNASLRDIRAEKGGDGDPPAMAFERLPAPERGYRLGFPAGLVPWLADDLRPTILLGKSFVAVAANPVLARAAIAAESRPADRWTPDDDLVEMLGCLPGNPAFLSVGNPRDSSWPEALANLPGTAIPFLSRFVGVDASDPTEAGPTPGLFGLLGITRPAASRVRIDPAKVPKAEELRALLFPSLVAALVDDRSFRVIRLEAFPLACLWVEETFKRPTGLQPMKFEVKFGPRK